MDGLGTLSLVDQPACSLQAWKCHPNVGLLGGGEFMMVDRTGTVGCSKQWGLEEFGVADRRWDFPS
jgi:hypothetical protein